MTGVLILLIGLFWFICGIVAIALMDSFYYYGQLFDWIKKAPRRIFGELVFILWPFVVIAMLIQMIKQRFFNKEEK